MKRKKLIRQLLDYNPLTGVFLWKVSRGGTAKLGTVAGNLNKNLGYVMISIYDKPYYAHILAWFFVKGKWPKGEIDHKDTVRHHNWFSNLRDVSKSGNMQNLTKAHADNKTGFLGVTFDKQSGKPKAQLRVNGKLMLSAKFDTPEQAHTAYVEAKRKYSSTNTL